MKTVTWMVNGSTIVSSSTSLMFSPLTTSNAGSYTCSLTVTPRTPHVTADENPTESSAEVITVQSRSFFLLIILCVMSFSSVPSPGVTVSPNRGGPLYAGTGLSITCTATLDPSVNNNEQVTIEWNVMLGGRFSVSTTMGDSYTSILTISPLAEEDNDSTFTCTATINGGTTVMSTDTTTIDVMGESVSQLSCCRLSIPTFLLQLSPNQQ